MANSADPVQLAVCKGRVYLGSARQGLRDNYFGSDKGNIQKKKKNTHTHTKNNTLVIIAVNILWAHPLELPHLNVFIH